MQPTWHRVSTGTNDAAGPGTISLFFDYNLMNWSFGIRGETDPCWFSLYLDLGPITLSATYWRS